MIINPGATRKQIMVDMAVVAFDRTALEMDRKWGIDRTLAYHGIPAHSGCPLLSRSGPRNQRTRYRR